MSRLTSAVLVFGAVICYVSSGYACQSGWTAAPAGTCWRYFHSPETYNSARASCRAIGAELVTLPTRVDVIFFKGYRLFIGKASSRFWIGGHKYSGYWRWDGVNKGRIGSTADWYQGQPSNSGGIEDCLEALHEGVQWNDRRCSDAIPYVCEKE